MSETVYVLTREYDYEGESAVGVYASLESAQRAGVEHGDSDDTRSDWWERNPGEWARGSTPTMIVRREQVQP